MAYANKMDLFITLTSANTALLRVAEPDGTDAFTVELNRDGTATVVLFSNNVTMSNAELLDIMLARQALSSLTAE